MVKYLINEFILYFCNYIISNIPSHTIRLLYYRKIMGYKIGKHTYINLGCTFNVRRGFIIGDNCIINKDCRLDSRGTLTIQNNVSISEGTYILTADHDPSQPAFNGRSRAIFIEDYAYIGSGAMLLPGSNMKKGSILGARAVLTKTIPPYEIWVGLPAKKIGDRQKNLTYTVHYKRLFQ